MDLIQGLRQSGSKLIDSLRSGEQSTANSTISQVPIQPSVPMESITPSDRTSIIDKLRQSDSQMVNKLREEPKLIVLQDRGVQIKPQEIEQVLPTIFAEVSNRDPKKIELEIRTILNTAINRMKDWQNKKGVEKGLVDIMHQPNQYQGFNSDQYKKFVSGQLDFLGQKKAELVKQIIDKVVKEMESGIFTDNVTGAVNYIHKPDGRIIASGTTIFK